MGLKKLSVSFQHAQKSEVRNIGVIAHNNRKFFAKNVDQNRSADNVTYKSIELREFYHELFDDAVEKYNQTQRSNRKITDYYERIKNSKQEKLFEEIIVGFGNMKENCVGSDEWELKKQLCDEYMREFEKRNPNMKVFNAVLHLDEANPHLHIDFVPISTDKNRQHGLSTKVSMRQALCDQGFSPKRRNENGLMLWEESEREVMTGILRRHGLDRDHKNNHRRHLTIGEYKAQQAELEKMKAQTEKIKANVAAATKKIPDEVTAEEAAMLQNENALMQKKIEQQREQIAELVQRYSSPIVKFEVYNPDKLLYVARELENQNIQFAEEENALYVPKFALDQCRKIAADFKNIFPGIKDNIKMDIDVLVLSSESLDQLLDKLQALGYEIKHGKYLALKSPEAQKFTRLKSLGADYLPESLEKRIANRNIFPNAVHEKMERAVGVEREFHIEISKTIVAVQGLAFRPKKSYADKIYDFKNDDIINRLSKQILTITEFNIDSREKLYATAQEFENKIAENLERIKELESEIPALKKKNESGNCSDEQRRRYELLPDYIASLRSEIERDRLKLSRLSDVIRNYEQITGGDYVGGIVREQQAEAARIREEILRAQSADQKSKPQDQRRESVDAPAPKKS